MITINVSGNIVADAFIRNVNGTDVIVFSVASNRRYTTKAGETKEETTFIYCQIWNKKPEVKDLLFKGRSVNVMGFLNLRNYVGNDGVMRTSANVRVTSFQVFGKNKTTDPAAPAEASLHVDTSATATENEVLIIDDLPF